MSKEIDSRVVEMTFNNSNFDKNVKATLKSLDQLEAGMDFSGSTKSLSGLDKALGKVDFSKMASGIETVSSRFTTMGLVGVTTLQNITNKAINAGEQLLKSLTIEPITTGFDEYELKMKSVRTIMSSTGDDLATVNAALQELNEYSDQTIYSFADMTSNIGHFTNAGVNLEKSVGAMKGIANAAALSGASSQDASRAMYQLGQAMSGTAVRIMDWNSVENANMATLEFKEQIIETAVELGTLSKSVDGVATAQNGMVVNGTSFRDSLEQEWFTAEVLTETLNKYADSTTDVGKRATESATEVKTFTQLIGVLAEAVQSGWAQSFEIIFGDLEEAVKLWTGVNNAIGGIIGEISDQRNELIKGWDQFGGRNAAIDAIANSFNYLMAVLKPVQEAFTSIFPPTTGKDLAFITHAIAILTERLTVSSETADGIKRSFAGLFAVFDIIGKAIGFVAQVAIELVKTIFPVGESFLSTSASIGDFLVGLNEAIEDSEFFSYALKALMGIIDIIGSGINALGKSIAIIFGGPTNNATDELNNMSSAFNDISEVMDEFATKFKGVSDGFVSFTNTIKPLLDGFWNLFKSIFGGIAITIKEAFETGNFQPLLDLVNGLLTGGLIFKIQQFIKGLTETLAPLQTTVSTFNYGLNKMFTSLSGTLNAFADSLKAKALKEVAISIAILVGAITVLTFLDPERVGAGVIEISVLMGMLNATMTSMTKNVAGLAAVGSASKMLVALSASILILAFSVQVLSGMQLEKFAQGVSGVIVMLAALTGAIIVLSKFMGDKLTKISAQLIAFGFSILTLSTSIAILSALDTYDLVNSLGAVVGLIVALTVAIKHLDGANSLKAAASITILTIALNALVVPILTLGLIDANYIYQGLFSIGLALGGLYVVIKTIKGNDVLKAASGMILLSVALNMLVVPIAAMGLLPMETMQQGLIAFAVALGALVLASTIINGATLISSASGMILFAAALNMLVIPIAALGYLPWYVVLSGIGGMAIALLALGAVATPLSKVSDEMLKVGVGVLAMSAGIAILVAGLFALGTIGAVGLAGLAAGITAAIGVIVAGLGTLIVEILLVLVAISGPVILALESLLNIVIYALIDLAPNLVEGILIFLEVALESIMGRIGPIVDALVVILIEIIQSLNAHLPTLIAEVMILLGNIIQGVADGLGMIGLEDASALILTIGALAAVFVILARMGKDAASAMKTTLVMGIILGSVVAALVILNIVDTGSMISIMSGLVILMPMVAITINILKNVDFTAGLKAAAAFGIFMGAVMLIAIVLGEIGRHWTDLIPILETGIEISKLIGEFIGAFIGGVIGAIIESINESVANSMLLMSYTFIGIGTNMSLFWDKIQPFVEGMETVKPEVFTGVKTLVDSFLALSVAGMLEGLMTLFGGNVAWATIGEKMNELGKAIVGYSDIITAGNVDADAVEKSAIAAGILVDLANTLPGADGFMQDFFGEKDMGAFAEDLVAFGNALVSYSNLVKGDALDETAVENSRRIATIMVDLNKDLPALNGVAQFFTGQATLDEFGSQLHTFGQYLVLYSAVVSGADGGPGVNEEAVTASGRAGQIMVDLLNNLPEKGGLMGSIFGEQSMALFGAELLVFGHYLSQYASIINEANLDQDAVQKSADAAQIMMDLQNGLPETGGLKAVIFGDKSLGEFAEELVIFAQWFGAYADLMADTDMDVIEGTAAAIETLVALADGVPTTGGLFDWATGSDDLGAFGKTLIQFGEGVKGYYDYIKDVGPDQLAAVTEQVTSILNIANTASQVSAGDFEVFGESFNLLGKEGLNGFVKAFEDADDTLATSIANLIIDTANSIKNDPASYSEFHELGSESSRYYADGIMSGETTVEDAIMAVISNAQAAANDTSVWLSIGKNISISIAQGIADNAYLVAQAAAAAQANQAQPDLPGVTSVEKTTYEPKTYSFPSSSSSGSSGGSFGPSPSSTFSTPDVTKFTTEVNKATEATDKAAESASGWGNVISDSLSPIMGGSGSSDISTNIFDFIGETIGFDVAGNAAARTEASYTPEDLGIEKQIEEMQEEFAQTTTTPSSGGGGGSSGGSSNIPDAMEELKEAYETEAKLIDEQADHNEITIADQIAAYENMSEKYGENADVRLDIDRKLVEFTEDAYDQEKRIIDDAASHKEISTEDQILAYEELSNKYGENAEIKLEIDRELLKLNEQYNEEQFQNSSDWIDKEVKYNNMSKEEQLEAWERVLSQYEAGSEQYLDAEEKIYDLRKEIEQDYYDDSVAQIENRIDAEKLTYQEQIDIWRDLRDQYEENSEYYIGIEDKILAAREAAQDAYYEKVEDVTEKIKTIQEDYNKAVEDRTKEIMNTYGLFDEVVVEMEDKLDSEGNKVYEGRITEFDENGNEIVIEEGIVVQVPVTVDKKDLMQNLEDQLESMQDYYEKLDKLASREGVSMALVDEIAAMGIGSEKELDAILSMSGTQLEKYSEMFEEKQAFANERAVSELATLKEESRDEIEELIESLSTFLEQESPKLGIELSTGILDGIGLANTALHGVLGSTTETIREMAEQLGSVIYIDGVAQETPEQGEGIIDGIVTGMQNGLPEVKDQTEETINTIINTTIDNNSLFETSGTDSMVAFTTGMESYEYDLTKSTDSLINNVIDRIRGFRQDFYASGSYLVDGFSDGIYDYIESAAQAAAAMAKAAKDAANQELGINSQSKESYETASWYIQGFVNSIYDGIPMTRLSMEDFASEVDSTFQEALNQAIYAVDNMAEYEPTIRPVLDLGEIQNGVRGMNGLLNSNSRLSVGVNANRAGLVQPAPSVPEPVATTSNQNQTPSVTFNQVVNSPKAVSTTEVYRQTKNLISNIKGVVPKND